MALTTGTFSDYGGQFHFPSGTVISPCEVLDFPELSGAERMTTNHGSGGWEERRFAGLNKAGDFTVSILETPGIFATLETARKNGTENVTFIKSPTGGASFLFTGWIKSIKKASADSNSPATGKMTVTVTPVGEITPV